tara:strand:+ start:824 stop:1201 length:378 start_codon:yes stop_codon:yes gene_type:complete
MKTKLEIIEETVNHYTTERNSRAMDGLECVYNAEDGSHCAIGRCFKDSYRNEGHEFKFNQDTDTGDLDNELGGLDSFLSEEYKGHDSAFWGNLQSLHDRNRYWNNDFELSIGGNEYVEKLKKENL